MGQRVCWPLLSNYWGACSPVPPPPPPASYAYVWYQIYDVVGIGDKQCIPCSAKFSMALPTEILSKKKTKKKKKKKLQTFSKNILRSFYSVIYMLLLYFLQQKHQNFSNHYLFSFIYRKPNHTNAFSVKTKIICDFPSLITSLHSKLKLLGR